LADPPASWRPGTARAAILDFVRLITEAGESFMPQPIDEDPGKPVHIWTRTGPKPLLAGREREPLWRRAGWHDWRPLGQEYPLGGSPG
jgi:hypothetical protein